MDVAGLPVALLHQRLSGNEHDDDDEKEENDIETCSPPLIASWISAVHTRRQTVRATLEYN